MNTSRIISLFIAMGLAVAQVSAMDDVAPDFDAAVNSTQASAEAAQAAQKAAEALKDKVSGLTEEAKKQFAKKTAQLEKLLKTQSTQLEKTQESLGKKYGKAFVAFGKEHKTLVIAGSIGVVVLGGTVYIVGKSGTLTKIKEWFKDHPFETTQLIVYSSLGTLAAAAVGLGAADHMEYIDLKAAKDSALQTRKAVGSWVVEKGINCAKFLAPYVNTNQAKIAGVITGFAATGVGATIAYNKFFGPKASVKGPKASVKKNDGEKKEESKEKEKTTDKKSTLLPSMPSASSFVPSFLSNKKAEEEAAKKIAAEEETQKKEAAEKEAKKIAAENDKAKEKAAKKKAAEKEKARLAKAKTNLLDAANNMNAEQVTELAKNFSPAVRSAAAEFVGALGKNRNFVKQTTIEKAKTSGPTRGGKPVVSAYDKLVKTL